MNCEEFKSRIDEMFDSEPIDKEMWKHIAECDDCRNYYAEYCTVVSFLTPKAIPDTPADLAMPGNKHDRRAIMRYVSYAAMVMVVALLAVFGFYYNMTNKANAASTTFGNALFAMNNVDAFSATIMVRTSPQDNFDFIDVALPFVEHKLDVALNNGTHVWRLNKGDEHFVMCDGKAQYQWWEDSKKATICSTDYNIIYYFSMLVNMSKLMDYEKMQVEQSKGNSYRVERTDTTLILTVSSHQQIFPHPLLDNNQSMSQMDNEREYVFDVMTNRLKQMRYWVFADGKKHLILESRDFKYGGNLSAGQITLLSDTDYEWIDMRVDMPIPAARLTTLQQEQPEDAASRVLASIFSGELSSSQEALRLYETTYLRNKWNGYTLVGCKEVIHSDGYNGVYAVMEVLSPRKEHKTIVLALRNDNPLKIWIVDGGI